MPFDQIKQGVILTTPSQSDINSNLLFYFHLFVFSVSKIYQLFNPLQYSFGIILVTSRNSIQCINLRQGGVGGFWCCFLFFPDTFSHTFQGELKRPGPVTVRKPHGSKPLGILHLC